MKKVTKLVIVASLSILFGINWIFGFEPQVVRPGYEPVRDTSFQAYARVVKQNNDTFWLRTMAIVTYPGARVGALVHNKLVEK